MSNEQKLAEALRLAQRFIDGMRADLHHLRPTEWDEEGSWDAACTASENMRLLGNACADFDCIGAALAEYEEWKAAPHLFIQSGRSLWQAYTDAKARAESLTEQNKLLLDALWKAAGDDKEAVGSYLESVGLPSSMATEYGGANE